MNLFAEGFPWLQAAAVIFVVLVVFSLVYMARRYKRCPSDMILVVYGKTAGNLTAKCVHGGGTFVLPLIQDCTFMSLVPMTINIPLQNALSFQNIRIHVPSTFTVAVSTDPNIMTNAAERLLGLGSQEIERMAQEIIFGQLRLTVASLTIEQINQDRQKFLASIQHNVEPELNKIGLQLINVNITDITDESDYIESIGKKAAAEAIQQARVDVAIHEKSGAIGQSEATREREIRVAENIAASEKGKKKAEADQRVFVQQQEAAAVIGEAEANRTQTIKVAENVAASEKGKKKAEADRRIFIQGQEAEAIKGENEAKIEIAEANAALAVKQAEATKIAEVARRQAIVDIQKAEYSAETERLTAEEVARVEIEKRKIEIAADAEAERIRRVAKGKADAILFQYEAEAKGIRQVLENKAAGYEALVQSCAGNPKEAATLLMIEKIEDIVARQVEAIQNLKIDKVTVWDSGNGADGSSSTANFLSSLIKSLPPLQDISKMAGVELPEYLGKLTDGPGASPKSPRDSNQAAKDK